MCRKNHLVQLSDLQRWGNGPRTEEVTGCPNEITSCMKYHAAHPLHEAIFLEAKIFHHFVITVLVPPSHVAVR